MADVTIRPVAEGDLPQVLAMVRALAEHHGDQASLEIETLKRDVLGRTPWLTVLVAERARALVGYSALCPLAQLQFGLRGMDMHHLFVASGARRQGVGTALISASQAHAKAVGCAYLAVGAHLDNSAAQQVYLEAGFEQRPPAGPRFGIQL